ncbi:universal stress protein [Streptomyces sp. NPDC089173]|uniref:universal stress protein n=1 Tax=Streptomyces sp. NPDC089173 TaxID=3154965 RepID=UPI003450F099
MHAGPVLVETARSCDDLLVVGTGPRGGWLSRIRPSVTRYCATHATCPVLTVARTRSKPNRPRYTWLLRPRRAGTTSDSRFLASASPRSRRGGVPQSRGRAPEELCSGIFGPQISEKDQGPLSDHSETGPEPRLSRVGTTGFEPATP